MVERGREEHDAVDDDRRGFHRLQHRGLEDECGLQLADIAGVDLAAGVEPRLLVAAVRVHPVFASPPAPSSMAWVTGAGALAIGRAVVVAPPEISCAPAKPTDAIPMAAIVAAPAHVIPLRMVPPAVCLVIARLRNSDRPAGALAKRSGRFRAGCVIFHLTVCCKPARLVRCNKRRAFPMRTKIHP